MKAVVFPRQRELALAVCMCLGLVACGGGGGGTRSGGSGGSVTTPPPVTPPPVTPPPAADPLLNAHLVLTHADTAHAAGVTGAGQYVTVIDSGVDAAHPALAGRVAMQVSVVDPSTNDTSRADVSGHGTAVAQIIAGSAFGKFDGGVAPGATLRSLRIVPDKAPVGQPAPAVTPEAFRQAWSTPPYGLASYIHVHTWGGTTIDATDTNLMRDWVATVTGSPYSLSIFAAGDSGKADPNDLAALPAHYAAPIWREWLTVVALDAANPAALAAGSNRCGVTANYCLAAPGSVTTVAASSTPGNPVYETWTGTGIAAAQVGGAAALVREVFPDLDYDSLRQVLLSTADDLGAPGIDPVFGNGRLNVARAIRGPSSIDDALLKLEAYEGRSRVFSNDIGGNGALRTFTDENTSITFSGRLTYKGETHAFGNVTSLHGFPGKLVVEGHITTLGDVGGNVHNSATLITVDTPVRVHGDYWQAADYAGLQGKLGAPLQVDGTAHLLGGDFRVAGAVPGYVPTAHQAVLQAGAIDGTFQTLTFAPGVFLSATLQYTPTEVWLDTRSLTVSSVAATTMRESGAAISSASRLDGAFAQIDRALADPTANPATQDLSTLLAAGNIQQSRDTKAAQASLESLSGQLYAAGTAVTLAGIEAGNDALIDHLGQQGAVGAWTQSLGLQGSMSRGGFGSVGFSLGGNLVGTDVRLGQTGFAGVAVGQMRSSGQLSGQFDRQRNRATEGMLYAGSRGDRWYGVGRLGFGGFRGDVSRLLRFGDTAALAGSESTGHYNVAYGEMGYRSQIGAFSVTPFANAQFATIRRSGFEERGGSGFGLRANGQTTSRWQAGLGLRAGASWLTTFGNVRLDGKVAWQGAFATRGDAFSARYTGFAQWAPVDGIGLSRHAATTGMTLAWDMSSRARLGLDVDQRFADRDRSRSAQVSYRLAW